LGAKITGDSLVYGIVFSEKARRQFLKLAKDMQIRIINSLDRIKIRPEAYVTKLVGDPAYKLRVGDYRVIMDMDRGKLAILIIKVGHRKNIYK
jgi:mRNA interferase RelE/StbE